MAIPNAFAVEIAGLGMSMMDLLQVVDEFPDDEGVVEASESRLMGGGPVPTALVTAAKLGARTAVIDRIGADWCGALVEAEFRATGVDTTHLTLEEGKSTTLGSVRVRKRDGARHVVFSPGNFTPLTADDLPADLLANTGIIHLNGRHWPACIEAARIVREAGGRVSFDGGAHRFREEILELFSFVDIAIVARDFAEQLSGSDDTGDQLAGLIGLGVSVAGVTDGAKGSWIADSAGEVFHQPAFAVAKVVDTTGCGDVYHGAFLFGLARDWSLRECATFASAAAAQNATAIGGRGNLPDLGSIRDTIAASRDWTEAPEMPDD